MLLDIKQNALSEENSNNIKKIFFGDSFGWYWSGKTSFEAEREHIVNRGAFADTMNIIDLGQFSHVFVSNRKVNSEYKILIEPIIKYVRDNYPVKDIIRAKANFLTQMPTYPSDAVNLPHYDNKDNVISALYYVNTADGDTVFYNECYDDFPMKLTEHKRVQPEFNKLVVFDSSYYHASANPSLDGPRAVVNIIFEKDVS